MSCRSICPSCLNWVTGLGCAVLFPDEVEHDCNNLRIWRELIADGVGRGQQDGQDMPHGQSGSSVRHMNWPLEHEWTS
jgi:hypothetical protein